MDNKLQELTDRLYQEGLSKGREEGERILGEARKKAADTIADAEGRAAGIIADAEKEARDLQSKVESDIKMASAQALQATRKDIENVIVSSLVDGKVGAALSDPDFLKKIISEVAAKFSAQESSDLALILPESLSSELEPFVKNELKSILGKEVAVTFSKKIAGGFTIAPKDGSYFINLTDEAFKALIGEYLRPVTRKFLFG